ncbi:MAG: Gfo/Idh/MocA family oxidoreductase [Ktedonobacterales bacterium]|nr:Gfo/Idh/MocA family oxidoreductase [Ktedonobacterales bacterium]
MTDRQHHPATSAPAAPAATSTRLRFGVIGYGYWGPQVTRNLDRVPNGRVTHIAELAPARREAAHHEHPAVHIIASAEDVLASAVDAVAIATPIRTHYALARQALECGKHVLVEKPLASNVAEAEALLALAEEQGKVLMVGHTYLYNPAVEQLRQLVRDGVLGRIYYVDAVRANLGLFQPNINVIWDLAPHDLAILGYVLGAQPLRVSAHGAAYVRPSIHDIAHLTLEYPGKVLAHIQVSWLSPSKVRRFTIVGDQRMVVYDDVEATEKIRVYNRGIDVPDHTSTFGEFQMSYRYGDIVSPHIHWAEPLSLQCRSFAEAIVSGTPPLSDARNGLEVVRVLAAADASLATDSTFVPVSA